MIRFNNVTKHYDSGHCALRNISFEIGEGEMAFLTGHSGAGKSTLLRLIMLMERASRGQILINNSPIEHLPKRHIPALRQHIGVISQSPELINERTVFDNVALPLVLQGFRPRDCARRVSAALDKVGLRNKERHHPRALSTGEQQRVSIARAVVSKPSIILADEPTGNLDPALASDIMALFEAFNDVGVTIFIVTHDLGLIATLNHRILTLKNGELIGT